MFRRKSDSVMPKSAESADAEVKGDRRSVPGFDRGRSVTVSGGRLGRAYCDVVCDVLCVCVCDVLCACDLQFCLGVACMELPLFWPPLGGGGGGE